MSITALQFRDLEGELHADARQISGLDDFGDSGYLQGLRVLLAALDTDLQLTETAWQYAYYWMQGLLIARLYAQRGWNEHPEVLGIPIRRPLIITGMPRTGTTALHRLLSVDPQFQALEYWLAATPTIRPPRESWDTHPEYRARIATLVAYYSDTPDLPSAHETVAAEAEECGIVLMQSFVSSVWSLCSLPTYRRWQLTQTAQGSYRRYADVLRLIGKRDLHKPWLLKDPAHMAEIDSLLEVFPDACIIQMHRDPVNTIPSLCNLMHMTRRGLAGEPADIGPRHCQFWRDALMRIHAACEKHPKQFCHVEHRQMLSDPMGTVRSIYDYFGLTLSEHTERQMRAWIEHRPTTRQSVHQHAVNAWGVTPAEIGELFSDYRARQGFS